jgi:uridine kinase
LLESSDLRPARIVGVSATSDFNEVVKAVSACVAPPDVETRIVGIDGHGGAGKSTLAERLQSVLGTQVVHTDDFASWDNPINWWPLLVKRVLIPLAAGRPATFQPTQWGATKPDRITLQPEQLTILEGVTAIRSAFGPYLALKIWVETPRELCIERGVARDGEEAREQWERGFDAENGYVAREQPHTHADIVVDGRQAF